MRVCLLASGSSGNALFVETGQTRLLVDAGLSCRELTKRLATIAVAADTIDAVLVTHEHGDHVRGLGTFARKSGAMVFASHRIGRGLRDAFGTFPMTEFEAGDPFTFRDLSIDPFPITHDVCDPVAFRIEGGEGPLGVATDLGMVTRLVEVKLTGCRLLVLESNHDETMLLNGPYPWHLKQRIQSRHGHLSNDQSLSLLRSLLHEGLEGILVAHLSETNNDPALVRSLFQRELSSQNRCEPTLAIGEQSRPSPVVSLHGFRPR
ncbi:MAG: MBL fold metallo-hydrolase [Desulfuromonadia bacterium]